MRSTPRKSSSIAAESRGKPGELAPRAGLGALAGVAGAALRFLPPLYPQAVFGPAASWFARRRERSEFTVLDPRRPRRTIAYLSRVFVPSVDRPPPPPLEKLLPAAVRDLFWRPTTVFDHPPRGRSAGADRARPGERWFFINGVLTDRAVAELNADLLFEIFCRPLTVIQNSTNSLALDVWEAAIGKEFKDDPDLEIRESFTEPCLVATAAILEAVNDAAVERVVVLAHSQGTIIAANVLRAVARALEAEEGARESGRGRGGLERAAAALTGDVPPRLAPVCRRFEEALLDLCGTEEVAHERLKKLEVYTFANCADTMKYVSTRGDRPVPRLEHFANERDLVARLGVLSPLRSRPAAIDIDGPLYLRQATRWPADGGWGHLLNQHYLFAIADYLATRADAGQTARVLDGTPLAPPYTGGPGAPPEPRLYGYFGGADPGRLG